MRLLILFIFILCSWVVNGQIVRTHPYYKPFAASGCTPDADAQKFIDSTGITDQTQKDAICTLVRELKDSLLWSSMNAIYPFVGCGRSNPPNRAACFYCAHALVVVPEKSGFAGLKIKHPEDWEPALNVIVTGGLNGGQGRIETVARIINAEPAAIAGLAACERPLPLLRVSSVIEADMVVRALEDIGVDVLVLSDAELMPDTSPIRLRSLDFGDSDLLVTDFNTRERLAIARSDVASL